MTVTPASPNAPDPTVPGPTALPGKGDLSNSFRRFALRASLIGSLMAVTGPNAETDVATPAAGQAALASRAPRKSASPPPDPSAAPDAAPPLLGAAERARRARIREALLDSARADLGPLEAGSETGYSQALAARAAALTQRLKTANSAVHNKVVFVDPEKLDVALSLGFAPDFAIQSQLDSGGVSLSGKNRLLAGDKAVSSYQSKFGLMSNTQDPTAITNLKDPKPEACIVVPSSEHALSVTIPGLSRAETVDFTNSHESWHCLDSKYNLRHIDPKKIAATKPGTLAAHVNDMTTLDVYATLYRKEALADTGAVGDMIRQGKGLDFLDKVSDWRASDPKDLQHLSSPVLQGLKQRIEEMGVEKFRQLGDAEAQKIYFEVTDTWGMTAKSLQTDIRLGSMGAKDRQALLERAHTDPDAARAVVLMSYAMKAPKPAGTALSPAEQAVAGQLKAWDAEKRLDDRAFAAGGKITPATLITAYNALQEELRGKMAAEPDNQLYPLQATKLQATFMVQTRAMDYVQVNADRGVDIVKADPALSAFSAPPVRTAAARAPSKS